jgi:YidC/Oxa1 family membrane protein insertase
MDRKSIIVIVLCFVLIGLWTFVIVPKYYPVKPMPPGATNAPGAGVIATTNPPWSSTTPPVLAEAPAIVPKAVVITNGPKEMIEEVTNANARYFFTSYGGGLKRVELVHYPETVASWREKRPPTGRVATLNSFTPAPTLAVLDGGEIQGDGIFNLTRTTNGVRAAKALTNGLTIVKNFQLDSDYLVTATVRLENHSGQPLPLPAQEWFVGTATPLDPLDKGQFVGVMFRYTNSGVQSVGQSFFASGGCRQRIAPAEYRGSLTNVEWAAIHNQFFVLAVVPQQPADALVVRKVELPRPTGEDAQMVAVNAAAPQGYAATLVYPGLTLAPGESVERKVYVFAGPKEFQTLARLSDRFGNKLDSLMRFGWAGMVSKALLLSMNWMHETLRFSYGWAIIAITLTIKLIFWPLTQASTRSAKRMQALQPQANAIKEKYKDDPVKAQRKMMELWKENKVSPMSGCLPMVIQIPVFFGFYQMIQSAIELRGAHFLWVSDLAKPDTLYVIPGLGFVPFFGIPGVGLPFNLLPLIMGATMLWQARLTPPSPGMDPAQAKMMRYMPLMFMVFLYNFSAGLTLYWTVQNLLTITQTKLVKTAQNAAPAPKPGLTPPQKKKK